MASLDVRRRVRSAQQGLKRGASDVKDRVITPAFVERHVERATRSGQWLAAGLLLVVIPISLIFVRILHGMFIRFLLGSRANVEEHTPFLVTILTFAILIVAAWLWAQWVRTAGFGMTNVLGGPR